MAIVTIDGVSIGYRGPPLLDEVSCRLEHGERIGLLGRNGAGKSTLMAILAGTVEPDHGAVSFAPGARAALLPQDVPRDLTGRVADVVAAGLPPEKREVHSAWQGEQQVKQLLSRMELDGAAAFETLSSGMKRRVLLARTVVGEPELLLLDEPTNHLDIAAIEWLEEFLLRWPATLMFVTHDRVFLRKLAGRILELDRGALLDWSCDYDTFLARKEAVLAAEEKQIALFDKRLAQEETWIRKGILARRTRNEGRVRALEEMRLKRQERREVVGRVRMSIDQQQRSGRLVVDAKQIAFAYGDKKVFGPFSTTIMRGDKIGIIGPNGAGKTTLLRVLLGELAPTAGAVRLGTNLGVAYFDQLRGQLDDQQTVAENVGQGYDTVEVGGKKKHVLGYLQDFLFTPERARTPVRFLSGGERNRVLLARLFAKPANVVVLDEPTNDLDSETLELLEEQLMDYEGTVLLVSHDRAFLNNVVTSTIVFEGGTVREYVGGYDDWLRQRAAAAEESPKERSPQKAKKPPERREALSGPRRRNYNEKRELAELPGVIERLESQIDEHHATMAGPEFYKQPGDEIARQTAELRQLEQQLAEAFARWEHLESLAE